MVVVVVDKVVFVGVRLVDVVLVVVEAVVVVCMVVVLGEVVDIGVDCVVQNCGSEVVVLGVVVPLVVGFENVVEGNVIVVDGVVVIVVDEVDAAGNEVVLTVLVEAREVDNIEVLITEEDVVELANNVDVAEGVVVCFDAEVVDGAGVVCATIIVKTPYEVLPCLTEHPTTICKISGWLIC